MMKFALYLRYVTACFLLFCLTGCVNVTSTEQTYEQHSEAVKARLNLALAYLEQNDFPKAKQNIDKSLAYAVDDYLPYSVLAYYYQQVGELENAESSYQKALALSQKQTKDNTIHPDVQNNYGAFLCKLGKVSEAYSQFEQALHSTTYYHQADTLENIVLCAHQAKNFVKQTQALNQLEKLDSERANQLKNKLK